MSSLLSQDEVNSISGDIENIQDTLVRNIIIHKEPLKTPVLTSTPQIFGFGENQTEDSFSYTPVTGIYPAVIRYPPLDQETLINPDLVSYVSKGTVSIRVRTDARDFINNGSTPKIIVDGRNFLLDGDETVRRMFNQNLYEFNLKAMK